MPVGCPAGNGSVIFPLSDDETPRSACVRFMTLSLSGEFRRHASGLKNGINSRVSSAGIVAASHPMLASPGALAHRK